MDENALEKITKDAIEFVSGNSQELVSIERKKNLLTAKILAKQLGRVRRKRRRTIFLTR